MAGEAFALGCTSPLLINQSFLSGWRLKLSQGPCTKHSVTFEALIESEMLYGVQGHSANEYLEYNRQESISVEMMKYEDPAEHEKVIFEGVERSHVTLRDLLFFCKETEDKEEDASSSTSSSCSKMTTTPPAAVCHRADK